MTSRLATWFLALALFAWACLVAVNHPADEVQG